MLGEGKTYRLVVLLVAGVLLSGIIYAEEPPQTTVIEESSVSKAEEKPRVTWRERMRLLKSKVCGNADNETEGNCLKKASSKLNLQKRIVGVGCVLNPDMCGEEK